MLMSYATYGFNEPGLFARDLAAVKKEITVISGNHSREWKYLVKLMYVLTVPPQRHKNTCMKKRLASQGISRKDDSRTYA